jgi:hydrogenase expression/formation protein HypD
MKFVAEYRDADLANQYVDAIASITTRPWAMMEICGGQTQSSEGACAAYYRYRGSIG